MANHITVVQREDGGTTFSDTGLDLHIDFDGEVNKETALEAINNLKMYRYMREHPDATIAEGVKACKGK